MRFCITTCQSVVAAILPEFSDSPGVPRSYNTTDLGAPESERSRGSEWVEAGAKCFGSPQVDQNWQATCETHISRLLSFHKFGPTSLYSAGNYILISLFDRFWSPSGQRTRPAPAREMDFDSGQTVWSNQGSKHTLNRGLEFPYLPLHTEVALTSCRPGRRGPMTSGQKHWSNTGERWSDSQACTTLRFDRSPTHWSNQQVNRSGQLTDQKINQTEPPLPKPPRRMLHLPGRAGLAGLRKRVRTPTPPTAASTARLLRRRSHRLYVHPPLRVCACVCERKNWGWGGWMGGAQHDRDIRTPISCTHTHKLGAQILSHTHTNTSAPQFFHTRRGAARQKHRDNSVIYPF